MRNCQICRSNDRYVIRESYCSTKNPPLSLVQCSPCGHLYVDAPSLNQAWLDNYYLTQYKTDDKPFSDARLLSLANHIASFESQRVLDIGGTDGELKRRLEFRGVMCDVSGVGDWHKEKYDLVVLSHTLEHVYDLNSMFDRVISALKIDGVLIVEGPLWQDYSSTDYDHHWQHINKFRVVDLKRLFTDRGFSIIVSRDLPDYREYKTHRIVGQYAIG